MDELVRVGFASTAGEIPSLLERLRMHQKSTKRPETLEFLCDMEEMIASMLTATPSERAKLDSLLERLDKYQARYRQFETKKAIYLYITSGRTTKVSEVDISNISTDAEFFNLIRRRILDSHDYPKIFGFSRLPSRLGISDVRFIKFLVQDGVFGVLEGPSSVPSTSVLQAEEYEYDPIPSPEVPIPSDLFTHMLSQSSASLGDVWLRRILKRFGVIRHYKVGSMEITIQLFEERTVPKNARWGIQIVKDTGGYWAVPPSACRLSFQVVIGMVALALNVFYMRLWWQGSIDGTHKVCRSTSSAQFFYSPRSLTEWMYSQRYLSAALHRGKCIPPVG